MITISRTNSADKNFRMLVSQLDQDLDERNGVLQRQYDQYNVIDFIESVVVAYSEDEPVGCGCYKKFNNESVEIKRMFVDKRFRGMGISKLILTSLEELAHQHGFKNTVLETGYNQHEAIGLYIKLGYGKVDNYGPYVDMKESLCFRKEL